MITTKIAPIRIPATSVNLVLPWFTGKPYALYAHVRAVTTRGATAWSKPFGFNMRWESTPVPMVSKPGLVRWAPVEGATAYDVWYPDIRKVIRTHTNVADQRELYSFHLEDSWWQLARWRVRPVRQVVGALPNGLPAVSYGPWSPTYATTNPLWSAGKLQLRAAVSDAVSTDTKAAAHQLMPAMTFAGDTGTDGRQYRLFRAYAFTDRDCVNAVFRGSVVGGPAFAPRISGPLKLPTNQEELDAALAGILPSAKSENAKTYMADGTPVVASETWGAERSRPCRPPRRRHVDHALLLDGRPGGDQRRRGRDVLVLRRRVAAGRVRVGSRRPASARSRGPRSPARERRSSRACRRRAACSRRPAGARSSTQRRSSRGGPSSARPATRSSGRARSTPGARAAPSLTYATSSALQLGSGVWYYRVRGLNAAQVGTPGDDVVGADRRQGGPSDLPDPRVAR